MIRPPRAPYLSPHMPHPKQAVFLALDDVLEALYGGAAGGGKSDAILQGALQYVDVPGYSALILRKSYSDLSLPDAIMARSKEWLYGKPGVKWNEGMKSFTFTHIAGAKLAVPSRLTFGFLEKESDKYRYQGSAYQYIGFDELTQFRLADYRYLFSRLRRTVDLVGDVPLRMRGATNPGGVGHEWVKEWFIETGPSAGRLFVPALLDDNPSLDAVEYRLALEKLDDVTKAQLLYGRWDVRPDGDYFKQGCFSDFVEMADVDASKYRWVRRWDIAASKPAKNKDPDYTVGVLAGRELTSGQILIADVKRFRSTPDEVERIIKATAKQDGKAVPVRMEQEPGASGVHLVEHYARKVLWGWTFSADKVSGPKQVRALPFASAANRGQVTLARAPWNAAYISELEAFDLGAHDDQVDASSGAYHDLASLYRPGAATISPAAAYRSPPNRGLLRGAPGA